MHPADDKPKHKPNPKHTLEEILKSLQDLIRNDLLEGDATPPSASRATGPTAATAAGGELATLRHSLETLVREELTTEDAGPAAPSASDGSAPSAPGPDTAIPPEGLQEVFSFDAATQAVAPEHAPGATPPDQDDRQPGSIDLARATDGTETESSVAPPEPEAAPVQPGCDDSATAHSEALPAAGSAPTAEERPEFTPQADVAPSGVAVAAPVGEMVEAAGRLAAQLPPDTSPAETAGDWDDIPVLEEVVTETVAEHEPGELPDVAPLSLPAGHPAEAEGPKPGGPAPKARADSIDQPASHTPPDNLELPLPAPSRAHELAVRTVARLNIELRKAGKRPLDAKVIARLAMMLRETLESDAAKVENKPHE